MQLRVAAVELVHSPSSAAERDAASGAFRSSSAASPAESCQRRSQLVGAGSMRSAAFAGRLNPAGIGLVRNRRSSQTHEQPNGQRHEAGKPVDRIVQRHRQVLHHLAA